MNNTEHKFPYKWTLKDAHFTKDKGTVFSCFACGGGSTMGYKLAGYDVIGCNEIDPRMNKVYVANHHPKHNYLMDIRELVTKAKAHELPEELYNLDVLDGSPPCSSFSMSGVNGGREKGWGKRKKFREGQATQVLDTLFFDLIELAAALQPKIVIAENVKGLMEGEAFRYVQRIYNEFNNSNYYVCHSLVNGASMGVPQKRERVFFTAIRKDLASYIPNPNLFGEPSLTMNFNEKEIPWGEIYQPNVCDRPLHDKFQTLWEHREYGDLDLSNATYKLTGKENQNFSFKYLYKDKVANTITAKSGSSGACILYDEPRYRNREEVILCSSFPTDYNFEDERVDYICGMSVPPVMMAQVASRVYEQWLSKINVKC